jgi:hypothetical protein
MARDFSEILAEYRLRKSSAGPLREKMKALSEVYSGDVVLPLPELDRSEKAGVANLIQTGIDQLAMRVASTMPDVVYYPDTPGQKRSEQYARIRKYATLGWWYEGNMKQKMRRRARWLVGYGTAPVMVRPHHPKQMPWWHLRDPLSTYPPPGLDPDDLNPPDCIFAFKRSLTWLRDRFPEAFAGIYKGANPRPEDMFEMIEYVDNDVLVMGVIAPARDRWAPGGTQGGTLSHAELFRLPNRIGRCPVVIPARINLGGPMGQFDNALGMYRWQARLMALDLISIEKGIFPDTYLVSRPNEIAAYIDGPFDGRTGKVNVIKGGDVKEVVTQPSQAAGMSLDRLERAQRLTGGIPAEFGGECYDQRAEIFTADGWKFYDQIKVDDEVLTLNHETGLSEWQPLLKINVFPAGPRTMLRCEGRAHSSLSTLNHRWPVVSRWDGARKWTTSAELASNDRVPIAASNADLPIEPKWSDDVVELAAWYWTEGTAGTSNASIAKKQSAYPAHYERIRDLLARLFGPPTPVFPRRGRAPDEVPRWREMKINTVTGVGGFYLSAAATRLLRNAVPGPEKVPTFEFLRSLTQAQLELFLQVSMMADNSGDGKFGQRSLARAEAFGFAAILAGYSVTYRTRTRRDDRPGYVRDSYVQHIARLRRTRRVNPKENAQRGSATFEQIVYDGIVWCPTTANGTWLARRNGTIHFTGNSATNVRTGRRGDAILSAVVDFPVQEAQEVFQEALAFENRLAVAVDKAYFDTAKSFYVNLRGFRGKVDYTPSVHFTSDANTVTYSHAGADINNLVVGIGQRVGIGLMSRRTGQELDPLIEDPEREHDRVVSEALEQALLQGLQQQAQQGALPPSDLARIMLLVREDRQELAEAVQTAHDEAQQRQATPAPQGAPELQPGIAQPGAGAQGTPSVPQMPPGLDNLTAMLGALRSGQRGNAPLPMAPGGAAPPAG